MSRRLKWPGVCSARARLLITLEIVMALLDDVATIHYAQGILDSRSNEVQL